MVNFIRVLFESGLKDNTSLEFAAITGCLRISKESIFTGLNNLNIISIRSTNFDEYFGFKTDEVKKLCHYYNLDDKYETVKDWYNGYTFGQTNIYNPWSVIKQPLYNAVLSKNCAIMEHELNDIFEETISYMEQNEAYYHGMVTGLFTGIKGYAALSNRESGNGRSDLLLKPIRRSKEVFVIEFKVTKDIDEMDAKAEEALQQIENKKYDMELKNNGYRCISYYGIAFCGKECVVHCKNCCI